MYTNEKEKSRQTEKWRLFTEYHHFSYDSRRIFMNEIRALEQHLATHRLAIDWKQNKQTKHLSNRSSNHRRQTDRHDVLLCTETNEFSRFEKSEGVYGFFGPTESETSGENSETSLYPWISFLSKRWNRELDIYPVEILEFIINIRSNYSEYTVEFTLNRYEVHRLTTCL